MKELQNAAENRHAKRPSLAVSFSCTQRTSLDTQQLRYRVFVGEFGANLPARPWLRS